MTDRLRTAHQRAGGSPHDRDTRFPSPFEMETPPGAEGWEDMYSYSMVFSENRREYEDSMFWFRDAIHLPSVMPPWDCRW